VSFRFSHNCPSRFIAPRARLGAMYKTLMLRFQCITRRHPCALNTVTGTFLLPTNDETSAGGKSHNNFDHHYNSLFYFN
jgi:hypothetical protein